MDIVDLHLLEVLDVLPDRENLAILEHFSCLPCFGKSLNDFESVLGLLFFRLYVFFVVKVSPLFLDNGGTFMVKSFNHYVLLISYLLVARLHG